LTVVAAHHNLLKDEVIAVETALGAGLAKANLTSTVGTDGITVTGGTAAVIGSGTSITQQASTDSVPGYLSAADHATFSTKVNRSGDTMTGDLTMDNDKAVIFKETTANGTDSITVKAPASVTTSYTVQLPPAIASAGQVLTDVIGNGVLSWSTTGAGTVTSVSGTANQLTSTNPTTTPVLAIANPLTLPGAMTAGGAIAMSSNKITGLAAATANGDATRFEQTVLTSTDQTITGVKTFSGQLIGKGTATNDDAAAGYIGEYVSSYAGVQNFPANNVVGDGTSISLTAGDWDVSAVMFAVFTTLVTNVLLGISTTSGNSTSGLNPGDNRCDFETFSTAGNSSPTIPVYRLSLASSMTVYLKVQSSYTGATPTYYSRLSARRIR
jgi:hypothetical protein